MFIFQKIHQTSPLPRFFPCKKRFKNYENCKFWTASWAIRIPWTGFQTGTQNHAKLRQNTQKSPQNEHGKLWITLSQLQKIHPIAWRARMRQNAIAFAVHGLALLRESVPTSREFSKKRSEIRSQKCTPRSRNRRIISNACREAGQFEVYFIEK